MYGINKEAGFTPIKQIQASILRIVGARKEHPPTSAADLFTPEMVQNGVEEYEAMQEPFELSSSSSSKQMQSDY